MLNDKEAKQIAQKVNAIEIVQNHKIMAQEQASNISENIPEEETYGNHFEGLAAGTVEPSFQIPTIQVTVDHEKEIEEFQILNHAINASDQFETLLGLGRGGLMRETLLGLGQGGKTMEDMPQLCHSNQSDQDRNFPQVWCNSGIVRPKLPFQYKPFFQEFSHIRRIMHGCPI
ncbi:hypothetical protein LWI28_013262 [Acer negundo]|uniref:Uncharacterized protein n=1 Tax=Acer negundo TaxID=4023 RepID=A0AAD5IEM7_ACENE|nr:hypothetical protein LWI28_013262 [Acer negundo]